MTDGGASAPLFRMAPDLAIDALNLAYWAGQPPSLRVPLALAAALRRQGRAVTLFLDATVRHRFPHEAEVAAALDAGGEGVVVAASGVPADRLLLRHARDRQGLVVSRDTFRDHRRRFRRLIDDPARRIAGHVGSDCLHLPALGLAVPLPASATEALRDFRDATERTVIP